MTRYARAKGSNGSGGKAIEAATSWSQLKEEMCTDSRATPMPDDANVTNESDPGNVNPNNSSTEQKPSVWSDFTSSRKQTSNEFGTTVDGSLQHTDSKTSGTKWLGEASQSNPLRVSDGIGRNMKKYGKNKNIKKRDKRELEAMEIRRDFNLPNNIEVVKFDGFPVKKEDGDRLLNMQWTLKKRGIPRHEIKNIMKLERRRCEKALSRECRKVCYKCRQHGHVMSNCPELAEGFCSVCFKCGSTEHVSSQCKVTSDYKFSQCFVCGEQGHLAKHCPDNPRGLYPHGGGCRICGDVTHLKQNCPQLVEKQQASTITVDKVHDSRNVEALDNKIVHMPRKVSEKKIIKF